MLVRRTVQSGQRRGKVSRRSSPMKYVLLFTDSKDRARQWDSMPEAQRQAAYGPINDWFGKYSGKITGGQELQPERAATTGRFNNGKAGVTPGPLILGKEKIGGNPAVTVPHLGVAVAVWKEWATGGAR